jgi:hypothetical protein
MMVDLVKEGWVNTDKNVKMNSTFFMGTTIQSLGDLKGYSIHIMFLGMAIPSKVVQTNEDAVKLEADIWAIMGQGERVSCV